MCTVDSIYLHFEPLKIPLQILQLDCSLAMSSSDLISQASRSASELNSGDDEEMIPVVSLRGSIIVGKKVEDRRQGSRIGKRKPSIPLI